MAIIKDNVLTEGLSGAFGNHFVFKQLRGKTVVSCRPAKPRTQSAQQKENRNRFRQASEWAKHILLEPDKKAYYQKKARKLRLPNAYTAAIADYMRSAKVLQVNQYDNKMTFSVYKKDFDLAQIDIVLNNDAGEKEKRTLPRGESDFWLQQTELNAGVVVMITDAAGVVRQHTLLAA
ncbi:MAG: hypothetical protein ABI663_20510 [Chryseolinea sp.]